MPDTPSHVRWQPSFVVTIEEPTLGSKPKVVIPKSLEPVFEQENFAAPHPVEGKGEDAESEVPTEPEESIVEPEPAEQPSDGEPTIPQPSESPEVHCFLYKPALIPWQELT